eukprot:Amastigsp_a1829_428.p4 type:complete len:112 gc:universal Amastigsp_a1829_428:561-226(-)
MGFGHRRPGRTETACSSSMAAVVSTSRQSNPAIDARQYSAASSLCVACGRKGCTALPRPDAFAALALASRGRVMPRPSCARWGRTRQRMAHLTSPSTWLSSSEAAGRLART